MFSCAKCGVQACRTREKRALPKNCPIREEKILSEAMEEYQKSEIRQFYTTASEIESSGYLQWSRVKETMVLCRRLGYQRIGLAFCGGLKKEARILCGVLERNGFDVVSVMCKAGGCDKCEGGIDDAYKLHPGEFEAMCNPIFQAKLLNRQSCEINIVFGLCVGHDSLFYHYSNAFVTTLVVKDRVLAHNPIGAIYQDEGYYKTKLDIGEEALFCRELE